MVFQYENTYYKNEHICPAVKQLELVAYMYELVGRKPPTKHLNCTKNMKGGFKICQNLFGGYGSFRT